jgi:hypothetical protein
MCEDFNWSRVSIFVSLDIQLVRDKAAEPSSKTGFATLFHLDQAGLTDLTPAGK